MLKTPTQRQLLRHRSCASRIGIKEFAGSLVLVLTISLLPSCGSGSSQSTPDSPSSGTRITTSTTFYPAFDPNISDYVTTLQPGAPLQVSVVAPADTQVSIDGGPLQTLSFTSPVTVTAGQSFPIVVRSASGSKTYYVRALPANFPTWTTERPGTPQAEYYMFTPDIPLADGTLRRYVIIADSHGVPVWWYLSPTEPRSPIILANGNIAWTIPTGFEEHKLDATLVRAFAADTSNCAYFDKHELQQLPSGNFLIVVDVPRGPMDLTAFGGTATETVLDTEVQEVTPAGSAVWRWSPMDHIPITEINPVWWPDYIATAPADPYHVNSVAPDGSGYIISLRHVDAVIRVDRATGNITWKLGGAHRAESLTFVGDSIGKFGGQHDARLLPDGTLTVYDNGTNLGRGPRSLRYTINTVNRTATLIEQVQEPEVTDSLCCGSARKLPEGDWVMSWGLQPVIEETTPAGSRVLRLRMNEPYFSYRAQPVLSGVLDRAALRSGMDAQFPR